MCISANITIETGQPKSIELQIRRSVSNIFLSVSKHFLESKTHQTTVKIIIYCY